MLFLFANEYVETNNRKYSIFFIISNIEILEIGLLDNINDNRIVNKYKR